MMPLGDDNSLRKSTPIINYLLIALNVFFFFVELSGGEDFIMKWAFIPQRFTADPIGNIPTIFTAMFMHGGWLHLFSNMLYLWIFGDNVEDSMGHLKYLLFYLIGGVGAALAHVLVAPNSVVPTVGASGAIAAVLGSYLVLYPRSKVLTLIPLGIYFRFTTVPAVVVLGLWFVLQLFNGVIDLGGSDTGGVAFWAHIGGFVVGVVLAKAFASKHRNVLQPEW